MINTIFGPLYSSETLVNGSTLTSTNTATTDYAFRPTSKGVRWRLLNAKLFCSSIVLSGGNTLKLQIILHTAAGADIIIGQTTYTTSTTSDQGYVEIAGGDSPILIDYDNYIIFRMLWTITNTDDATADASAFFQVV